MRSDSSNWMIKYVYALGWDSVSTIRLSVNLERCSALRFSSAARSPLPKRMHVKKISKYRSESPNKRKKFCSMHLLSPWIFRIVFLVRFSHVWQYRHNSSAAVCRRCLLESSIRPGRNLTCYTQKCMFLLYKLETSTKWSCKCSSGLSFLCSVASDKWNAWRFSDFSICRSRFGLWPAFRGFLLRSSCLA